jgi:hypothetical protein
MKFRIIAIILLLAGLAYSQNPMGYLIYGNRDASTIRVRLGSIIAIPAWGATEFIYENDGVYYIHMPLETVDSIITGRLGGYFPDTLVGLWDYKAFLPIANHYSDPYIPEGMTNQSMLGMADLDDPIHPENWLNTNGDTVIICYFNMQITRNPIWGDAVMNPFQNGHDPANMELIWGLGIPEFEPVTTFSSLHLIGCENVAGDINNDSLFNGLDVIYALNYLKGIGPGPMCIQDCRNIGSVPSTADANGDCHFNGVDIVYSVNYFKRTGPNPRFCTDCPPIP